jgi:hypothetical protein
MFFFAANFKETGGCNMPDWKKWFTQSGKQKRAA